MSTCWRQPIVIFTARWAATISMVLNLAFLISKKMLMLALNGFPASLLHTHPSPPPPSRKRRSMVHGSGRLDWFQRRAANGTTVAVL
jgi:hypothetical protein